MVLLQTAWFSGPSEAATLRVTPVKLELSNGQPSTELRLRNSDRVDTSLQVQVFSWEQDESGADVLQPVQDLVAVPPVFSVAPGEEQIVRVGYLGQPDPVRERSYRLVLTELPGAPDSASGAAIQVRLRIVLPVFVAPMAGPAESSLELLAFRQDDDRLYVDLANKGTGHTRLENLRLLDGPGGAPVSQAGHSLYVLPGSQITLAMNMPAQNPGMQVELRTLDKEVLQRAVPMPQ